MKQNEKFFLEQVKFICANIEHMDFIYQSLLDMAIEEGIASRFTKTKEELEQIIFKDNQAECILCCFNDIFISLAVFSYTNRNFSLFEKAGMYVHDIYVIPSFRRKGVGTHMIDFLQSLAKERNLGRIDLVVLNRNADGVNFYKKYLNIKEIDYIKYMRISL